jgi:parallel beta-helix repeat protein
LSSACIWQSPAQIPSQIVATPDYFCSDNPSTSVVHIPNNFAGWQKSYTQNSATGYTGYAGILTYWGGNSTNPADADYREYLQIPLNTTLQAGKQYQISFRISKADKYKWASRNIGAWASHGAPTQANGDYIHPVIPQVNYSSYMDDTANWVLVTNHFYATGNENWLTIGQFTSDPGSYAPSTQYSGPGVNGAYYYIDDVKLLPYPDSLNVVASPSTICNGSTVTLTGQTNLSNAYYWTWFGTPSAGAGLLNNNNDTVRAIPTDTVLYTSVIHLPNYNGCTIKDTVTVNWKPGPTNCSAGNDVYTCLGGSVTLTGTLGAYGNYGTWTTLNNTVLCTNCTSTTISAPASGDYIFISAYSSSPTSCKDRDTVHVSGTSMSVQIVSPQGMATCDPNYIPFMTAGTYSSYWWTTNAPSSYGVINDTLMARWNSNTTVGTVNVTVMDANGCIGYASLTVPTCCTVSAEEVLVNTNTTAAYNNTSLFTIASGYYTATSRTFNINGIFHVNANTRIISSNVKFGPNAKVIIDPGYKLEITGTAIYACSDLGDGFYVDGTNGNSEILLNGGTSIQDMKNAIVSTNGGRFTIDGTNATVKLNKNNIGILVKPYAGTHPGRIRKTIISCDSPTQPGGNAFTYTSGNNLRAPIGGQAFAAILIDNCTDITIGDSASNSYRNLMERQKFGIYAMTSNVKVWNNDFKYFILTTPQPHNSPPQGVAVYAKGASTVTRTLTVGRVGNYKAHNLIRKCSYGVMAESYMNLKCEYNRIDSISTIGVYSLNNQMGKTILINRDSITEFTGTGINCTNVKQAVVTITNNQLNETSSSTPTNFGYTGIYVTNALSFTYSTVKIQNNTIKRIRNGIWVMNVLRAEILDNPITFYVGQPMTVQMPAIGIKLEATYCSLIRNNAISYGVAGNPAPTLYDKLLGISMTNCINDTITKNTITKCGSGIFMKGSNNPSLIACNTLVKNYYGINFGYSNAVQTTVILSDQVRWTHPYTGAATPTGNIWSGTISGQDLKGKISPAINWWCNSGNCPNTTGMVLNSLVTNAAISLPPTTPDKCTSMLSPVSPISAKDMRDALLSEICKTPRVYDTLSAQYHYIDSVFAYRKLIDNPSWTSLGTSDDSYYSAWKSAVASTNVGILAAIEDSIKGQQLAGASALLATLTPTGTPEGNRIAVMNVYLETWARDSMNLDSAQIVTLTAIANQAPVSGGIAVYDARAMLFREVHDSSALRLPPQAVTEVVSAHIYPNPSSGVLMLNYALPNNAAGVMEIRDITGRILEIYILAADTPVQQFDTGDIPAGLYFCTVRINGDAKLSEKVVIIKNY